jgi:Family of unknown function (DUF5906)/Domain of unknown function (DUF3854)
MSIHEESTNEKVIDISSARAARGKTSIKDLFLADIKRSGLSLEQAYKLGFKILSTDEIWAKLRPKQPERPAEFTVEGYLIPYFYPDGKLFPFFRIRKLRGKWMKEDNGSQRYASPHNSLPHVYMPVPLLNGSIPKRGRIAAQRLVITEGEKKAAKAATCGIFTIALGGVDSYRSSRHGIQLLEEFKEWFDFIETNLEICYDSDAYGNADVNRALSAFSDTLRREVNPKSLKQKRLTTENVGSKTGLDDFLAQYGRNDDARAAYDRLTAIEDVTGEAFAVFNNELVHVRKRTKYFNTNTGTWYPAQKQMVEEFSIGPSIPTDGKKSIFPITKWLTDRPPTTTVMDVVHIPAKPERYAQDGGLYINTWRATGLLPTPFKKAATIKPFLEFVEYLTASLTKEQREWLLNWTAYPLQNVGAKMQTAVLIWSMQGMGKNTFARILRAMYGDNNTSEIMGGSLADQFNEWMQSQLCIINEVHTPSYGERASVMNKLKTAISENFIDLRAMHHARNNVPNFANFYLNSNHSDALVLDSDDRRIFVVEGPEVAWSEKKFSEFNLWLENGGFEIIYGYLLKRDIKKFNPHAPAMITEAKLAMINSRSSPIDDIVDVLVKTPEKIFCWIDTETQKYTKPARELFMVSELLEQLQTYASTRNTRVVLTAGTLGSALRNHRICKRILEFGRDEQRRKMTIYAIFNRSKWEAAPIMKWRTYLTENSNGLLRK